MKPVNLDNTDWAILRELQADARLSYAEIGRRVGLSSPAVQERIRRLEDAGIIEGYHAKVSLKSFQVGLMAIIRLSNIQEFDVKQKIVDILDAIPEVTDCYQVTGEDEFVIIVHAQTMEHMSSIKMKFAPYARLVTSMIIKKPIDGRVISLENLPYLEDD